MDQEISKIGYYESMQSKQLSNRFLDYSDQDYHDMEGSGCEAAQEKSCDGDGQLFNLCVGTEGSDTACCSCPQQNARLMEDTKSDTSQSHSACCQCKPVRVICPAKG